jgi:hypothetical protein
LKVYFLFRIESNNQELPSEKHSIRRKNGVEVRVIAGESMGVPSFSCVN